MKTAALYIRVSTHYQEELSPDAQKRLLMDYATNNNLLVSDEFVYIESGISGRTADKRPEFQKMIGIAKQKKSPFDVILVWKFSRFARNQEESIVYKSLLSKNNIEVISISEPVIEGPFGSLIERIIEWMDEYYSIRLADEVHRGMTENALKGRYQASPPLGYKVLHKGEGPIVVPEQADVIRLIFDKYVNDGLSFYQITKHLNDLGYKTKQGKQFERRSVEYIIKNPMYKGYLRWNMTHNESNQLKDESEWIVVKGSHDPIVSEEVFDKAQKRFNKEYSPRKKARPVTEYKHWLSSLIKCSYCGSSMTASNVARSRYKQFGCNGYSKGKCAKSNSVSEAKLTPYILKAIEDIISTGQVEYSVIKRGVKTDVDLINKQLSNIKDKEKRIKIAYINGVDSIEEYKHNKEIIEKEKISLEKKLLQEKKNISKDYKKEMLSRIRDVYRIITDDSADNITRNKAMKSIIEKIVFNRENMNIDIYFYYS